MSEQYLWAAVLHQAQLDALCLNCAMTTVDLDEARAFCSADVGYWAESRQITCDAVGVLPDVFREESTKRIGSVPDPIRTTGHPQSTRDEVARLWVEGVVCSEIGRRLGISKSSVIRIAHNMALPSRPSPIRKRV